MIAILGSFLYSIITLVDAQGTLKIFSDCKNEVHIYLRQQDNTLKILIGYLQEKYPMKIPTSMNQSIMIQITQTDQSKFEEIILVDDDYMNVHIRQDSDIENCTVQKSYYTPSNVSMYTYDKQIVDDVNGNQNKDDEEEDDHDDIYDYLDYDDEDDDDDDDDDDDNSMYTKYRMDKDFYIEYLQYLENKELIIQSAAATQDWYVLHDYIPNQKYETVSIDSTINTTITITSTTTTTNDIIDRLIQSCKDDYKTTNNNNNNNSNNSIKVTQRSSSNTKEEYLYCVSRKVYHYLTYIRQKRDYFRARREKLSHSLRYYMCKDDTLMTSSPISISSYIVNSRNAVHVSQQDRTISNTSVNNNDISSSSSSRSSNDADSVNNIDTNITFEIKTLLNLTHSKIWYIENFITDDECYHLIQSSRYKLETATTSEMNRENSDSDGLGSTQGYISVNRKAKQAKYEFSSIDPVRDKLWPLHTRIIDITKHYTGYNLSYDGQESLSVIYYNTSDQYTPHCDGECDGSVYRSGGRVATAILYCQAADQGGATTFTKSDIYIKPIPGMAVFFSYKGLMDELMDPDGYTEHSGCPVRQGEKWITTLWMREGVHQSNPWYMYDPVGRPIRYNYVNTMNANVS